MFRPWSKDLQMTIKRVTCIVVLLCFLSIMVIYPIKGASSWDTQQVTPSSDLSRILTLSFKIDKDGNPHVCFISYETNFTTGAHNVLKYAYFNGIQWIISIVDNSGNAGDYLSLALNKSNTPHICYLDKKNGHLNYAYLNGSSWTIQTVDHNENVGYYCSLALDSRGNPHICYINQTRPFGILYAVGDLKKSHWDISTINTEYGVSWISLALKKNDLPCLSYFEYFRNQSLEYAWMENAKWNFNTVDYNTTVDSGRESSLALDSHDNPHISYLDATHSDLKYAYQTGSNWSIQTVDAKGEVGHSSSLSLDSDNHPHITYLDSSLKRIKYAFWTGYTWDIQYLDNGTKSAFALDPNNFPSICYINNGIKYAVPNILISSPVSGESWVLGSRHTIRWQIRAIDPFITISLLKNNESVLTIDNNSNSGSYDWSIPENLTSGPYEIKITSGLNNKIFASNLITIQEKPFPWSEYLLLLIIVIIIFIIIILALIYGMKKKKKINKEKGSE